MATAVVVTHARRALATSTVRMLLEEGFAPRDIVLVINGEGGLTDAGLEASIDTVRLAGNTGPAGGFRSGLERSLSDHDHPWIYLCEDDVCLVDLPRPVVRTSLDRVARFEEEQPAALRVGAVAAYGRCLDSRSGQTRPYEPSPGGDLLELVDCAAWGATLVRREAVAAGLRPDPDLFFGFEDFDFFLSFPSNGYGLYVDADLARAAATQVTPAGRAERFRGVRPTDAEEDWRHYYLARNFIALSRRHGRRRWLVVHLLRSFRRWQQASLRPSVGRAIVRGWSDGLRGRLGANARYLRHVEEEV